MNNNSKANTIRILLVFAIVLFSASFASALSLVGEFENQRASASVMPGQNAGYFVLVTADQNLTEMHVSGKLYDVTTGHEVFLADLFAADVYTTFYHPSEFYVKASDYGNRPGKYVIKLFAEETLSYGYYTSKTAELELRVIGNRPPIANFIYYPKNITTGMVVHLNSTSYDEDGYIIKWEWFVDSVKVAQKENITHVFNAPGQYDVTLRVTDNEGATASHTETLTVTQGEVTGYPVANFTNSSSLCEDEYVAFTSNSYDPDGTIVKEEWDLNNDGIFETQGHSASRLFQNEGTYTITLKVTDNRGLQTSISKTFTITECNVPPTQMPVANFTYSPTDVCVDSEVSFVSTSYDPDGYITSYSWDMNSDGTTDRTGSRAEYTFRTAGAYVVTLRVQDNSGVTGSTSKIIVVSQCQPANIPPVANFTYSPSENITTETEVAFLSTSYDPDGTIVEENWYVDGRFITNAHGWTKTFLTAGTHTIRLQVFDNDGASDSITKEIFVTQEEEENIPPVAEFEWNPENPLVGEPVFFVSTSYDPDGYIVKYQWYIEDVLASTSTDMVHIFTAPGTYEVTLTVTDNDGATASVTHDVTVSAVTENIPPVADFEYEPSHPIVDDVVVFTSTSYDPDGTIEKYEWFIGGVLVDNVTDEEMIHVFTSPGVYSVTLRVTDNEGATASVTKAVPVGENPCLPHAVLRVPESVYVGDNVQMDALLSTAGCNQTIVAYRWEVICRNSYFMDITTIPYFNYTFTTTGECRAILTVFTDAGLSDSDEKLVFAGLRARGIQEGNEDNLFVDNIEVTGTDFGEIQCGEPFMVTATVSNDRNEDLRNLKVTFAIPELGYRIESGKFNLDSGDTKTVSMMGFLDYMVGEIQCGEYASLVGVSDTDTVREKFFPLWIKA